MNLLEKMIAELLEFRSSTCHDRSAIVNREIKNCVLNISVSLRRSKLAMRLIKSGGFFAGLFILLAGQLIAETPDKKSTIVLKNANIQTVAQEGSFVGTIVVNDGKITAVGTDVEIPANSVEYDLRGHTVVPGLIDSRSVLWLTSAAAKEKSTGAALNVVDGIDPWQDDWQEVARQGVTSVYVQPTNASSLGGYGAVLCVAPNTNKQQLIVKDQAGVQAAIGITGKTSRDRFSQFEKLKNAIKKVKEGKKVDSKDQPAPRTSGASPRRPPFPTPGRGRRGAPQPRAQTSAVTLPNRTEELLKQVVDGKVPLHIEVHDSDAVRWVLAMAKEFDIPVVLDGLSRVGASMPQLADSSLPFVVGPLIETAQPPGYRKNARLDWLPTLSKDGRLWALSTFANNSRGSRMLRVQAAAAVANGVSRDEALKAITINPARLLGVSERIGSIEVGKRADLSVFAGDPLDPSVPTSVVICGGKIIHRADIEPHASVSITISEFTQTLPDEYVVKTSRLLQDGKFVPGMMLIRKETIAEVGQSIELPSGIRTVDVGDAVVSPGLVVAHSYLGQTESLTDDVDADTSHVRAIDAVDPTDEGAGRMLAGGFIHVAFPPASTNTSAGAIGQVRLGTGNYVAQTEIASKFVLADAGRNVNRFPSSITGQTAMLDAMFGGQIPRSRMFVSSAVRRSLRAEKQSGVQALLRNQRKALFEVETPLEIEAALRIAEKYKLGGALIGSEEFGQYEKEIKNSGLGLIIRSSDGSEYERRFVELGKLASADIPVAFAGDRPEQIRFTAALAVAAGMPREKALQGITAGGASLIGMSSGTAQLIAGATADFVIWSGSPLNMASRPLGVVVDGKLVESSKLIP